MSQAKDITGCRFGKWTALRFSRTRKKNNHLWWCRCDCGTEKEVNKYNLGKTSIQCALCANAPEDLTGRRFGKLTAIKYQGSGVWECQCDCGSITFISSSVLRKGRTITCRKCKWEDLTGMRFGHQTVIKRLYNEKAWLIQCDCGEELVKKSNAIKASSSCGRCETKKFLNMRFGKLVIKELQYAKGACKAYAQCDCGNWWIGTPYSLSSGVTQSCGCIIREKHMQSAQDMIGNKIGDLTIIKIMGYLFGTYSILFQARCKCGKKKLVCRNDLGSSKSCGCAIKMNRLTGENSPVSTLTNAEAEAIREFKKSNIGYTVPQLAAMFGVTESVIYHVLAGDTYKET